MTSPKVNFKGWAEAIATVHTKAPPKPGYQRLTEIAKELGKPSSTLRDQMARLVDAGFVDVIEIQNAKWYKLK